MKYDVIVIGVGGVGSAAAYYSAKRGARVLGIDRFNPGHSRGSSHGPARIVQKGCYHQSDYLPLLDRALDNWQELESLTGNQLISESGLLIVGPSDGVLITGTRSAWEQRVADLEPIDRQEFHKRFPGYHLDEGYEAFLELDAGHINPRNCVRGFVQAATAIGADFAIGEDVLGWRDCGAHVEVDTKTRTLVADQLVITPGPWATSLLGNLGVSFEVRRYHRHWYSPRQESDYAAEAGVPAYFFETQAGVYYGTPAEDSRGVMVVEYGDGEPVSDPSNVRWDVDLEERQRVETFIAEFLPRLTLTPKQHVICMSTMSPDRHFVLDQHPECSRVVFAAGLSGHGFKFASALGEALSQLSLENVSQLPVDFLGLDRLLDPASSQLESW